MLIAAGVVLSLAMQAPPTGLADAYFYFLQGRMLEGRGDVPGAIAAYRRATELEPKASAIHAELAGVYARAGRALDAVSEAEAAIALNATDREAHRILGLVQAALSENTTSGARQTQLMTDAMTHLEAALVGARDPGAELTLGRLQVRTDRLAKAAETLQNFLFDNPGYPEAVMLLAEAQARTGKIADAISTIEPLASSPEGQADVQSTLADLYEQAGRWKDAAAVWGALAVKSTDGSYRMQQATALINAGDVAAGRDVLLAVVKTRATDPSAWYLLAQAERRLNNLDAAEAAAKRITEIDMNDPRGPLAVAEAREARRDFAGVIATLQPVYDARRVSAKADDEVFGFVALTLANAYEAQNQIGNAEQVLRTLIARNATDEVALNALGYMLADRGLKLDEAVGFIKRALAADPANPSYLDSLGWAYFKQGKLSDALPPLEQAAKTASTSSMVLDHYGDALFAAKKYRDAAEAFTRALSGDRDGIDAATVIKKRDKAKELAK